MIEVYVENIPADIQLEDIGKVYLFGEIKKYSTTANLVYSKQTLLNDGSPAVETLFDRVIDNFWHLNTLILSTYYDGKLIFATVTSIAHPEALSEYLYSLQFH